MHCAVIRGIWGDHTSGRSKLPPPLAYHRIQRHVIDAVNRSEWIGDRVYCFGENNAVFLNSLGIDATMLSDRAVVTPWVSHKRLCGGSIVDGAHTNWHKLMIQRAALQEHDAIIWIDFHMEQIQIAPLSNDLWTQLHAGPRLQASLAVQNRWIWGAGWRCCDDAKWSTVGMKMVDGPETEKIRQARIVPLCGWMYIRGLDLIEEALEIQAANPRFMNQQVWALVLDRRYNGWIGVDEYIRRGHDSPSAWWYHGRQLNPPPQGQVLWQSGHRSPRHRRGSLLKG